VTGVDRSGALLGEAARRAEGGPSPAFVRADYRELPFDAERFDGALNLYTSLGYLGDEEDTKVLGEIRRVLRPGARLVIEMMHRDRMICGGHERDWRLMGEGRLMLEHHTFDPATGIAQTTQTLVENDGRRESHPFSVRVYTATELINMVERAGFDEWRCYGSFEMEPLSPQTRLVIVGIK
jgi:ubiquinone/menaquinone biosynthesis C-methylase UbiE